MLAQIPGADTAISAAAKHSWEAALLVVILLAIVTCFWWILRRTLDEAIKREKRIIADSQHREAHLAERVTTLENDIKAALFDQIRSNMEIIAKVIAVTEKMSGIVDQLILSVGRFTSLLESRPCLFHLHDPEQFEGLMRRVESNAE